MPEAVILAARRTAVGRAGGQFRARSASHLLGPVLHALLDDCGLQEAEVDRVIIGNAREGGNIARLAVLEAGFPPEVPASTVDVQCASGLEAILQAVWMVQAGAARVVLAGGVESASTAPWQVERPRSATAMPRFLMRTPFCGDAAADEAVATAAEAVVRACGIDRARQDAYTAQSHARAATAHKDGRFEFELVPLLGGEPECDEGPRAGLSEERLARLSPLVDDGTVTTGNSALPADGAAAVMVMEATMARALGATGALRLIDGVAGGVDPGLTGLGAVPAARRLSRRVGDLPLESLAQIEINEVFAGQALACINQLSLDPERVNPGGGTLAFGHPVGAVGAFLVVRLFHDLMSAPDQRGAVLLSSSAGLGLAALFETGAP
ncbi:thiolase family protein [Pararhodospirillum oryzae]|uniref:Acetyl-CoA acetyltransferase n=1 Tax=Pararhodospirillum oryzae TaxID=478448 RepID=A0A512H5Z1_9PROT|nr:thiolase family protein [Pararhodospirillum oryzae]GEO80863.1 acetyl-CoA acetyltransferase [Pararhodospirillum oryzae]